MIDYSALISDKARDIKPSGIRKFSMELNKKLVQNKGYEKSL